MAIVVRSPGSCGEFLQGSLDGNPFLITCPINRFSYALCQVQHPLKDTAISLQPKARKAIEYTLDYCKVSTMPSPIYAYSNIPQGKGMASSSADISAVALATALNVGKNLTLKELEYISLAIEPSDATFYPEIVEFDYLHGKISNPLGPCPPLQIIIFDEGGSVDTVSFNHRSDLAALIEEKSALIEESVTLFKRALEEHDVKKLGQASTLSAFANQRILPKPSLYEFHEIGQYYHSLGTIIAHSGTIMGLLFPVGSMQLIHCVEMIQRKLPQLTFIDIVETCNSGITYEKR